MEEKLKEIKHFERRSETVTKPVVQGPERSEYVIEDDTPKILEKIDEYTIMQQLIEWGHQGLAEESNLREFSMNVRDGVFRALKDDGRQSNKRLMLEDPWLFEEPNSVAGFNDSNKLYEAQKEIGGLIKRLHILRVADEEKERELKILREADKEKDREIKILQKDNKRLMNAMTEKDAKLGKREKNRVYNEKKYNDLEGSVRKSQERVESQSIKITKMQTETDGLRGNLVEAKNQLKNAREESANAKRKQAAAEKRCEAHKRSLVDAEKTRLDEQAIHASCLQNMEEAHEGIIQRKCDEVEGLRKRIEEKETMDAVKAAADAAEAKGIVKCTVEEIDAWEKEYDEKESAFLRECAYFVPKLTKEAQFAWSFDHNAAYIHLKEIYDKIRTAQQKTDKWCSSMNKGMYFCETAWEKHFVLRLRVNQLYLDTLDVETNLHVFEPSFSEAQIEVAMKITGKCREFYYDLQQKFEDDFSKVDDAKNGGRLIRKLGDFADAAE